jgi:hypothetical protein
MVRATMLAIFIRLLTQLFPAALRRASIDVSLMLLRASWIAFMNLRPTVSEKNIFITAFIVRPI